jgi:ribosomal protein S26
VSSEEYRNSKNWFSINVQAVCTPTLEFLNIVARWKGATHDSRIFLNSSLCAQFQRGQHSGLLLGDSGYGQSNVLFTPYINPTTAEQQRYNRAHVRTRGMVEHMLGRMEKSITVFAQYTQFQAKKMLRGDHCYSCAAHLWKIRVKQMCPWQRQAMTNEDLHTELLSHCSTSTR